MKALLITIATSSLAAPIAASQAGLLVVAHGANPAWNNRVRQTVAQVSWEGPVGAAFLMGVESDSAGFEAGVGRLVAAGAQTIVVVPLLISSAGSHYRQIRYYARELPAIPPELASHNHFTPPDRWPVPLRVTAALDGAPELGTILEDQWAALSDADRRRPAMFVAHGPGEESEATQWLRDLDRAIRPMTTKVSLPFAIGLLRDDAAPAVRHEAVTALRNEIERLARESADSVVVQSLLISQGTINSVTIPADLAGLPIRYRPSSLAPSPHLARWIERVAGESEALVASGRHH